MAISDTDSDRVPAQPAVTRVDNAATPETIYVYAPENIGWIKLVRQADDTDEDHIARQGMYTKLLKLQLEPSSKPEGC